MERGDLLLHKYAHLQREWVAPEAQPFDERPRHVVYDAGAALDACAVCTGCDRRGEEGVAVVCAEVEGARARRMRW